MQISVITIFGLFSRISSIPSEAVYEQVGETGMTSGAEDENGEASSFIVKNALEYIRENSREKLRLSDVAFTSVLFRSPMGIPIFTG